jgi:hypothetical protein
MVAAPMQERTTANLKDFFEHLPFVLPCKFCRYSLSGYYDTRPIPAKHEEFERWLYHIHNDVNGKLRSQNLLKTDNPTYEEVHKLYSAWASTPCASTQMLGWDFLFSVANTTPSKSSHSSPMEGAPTNTQTDKEKNKWNSMSYRERLPYVQKWWNLLGSVLPFKPWRDAWQKGTAAMGLAPVKKGKKAVLAWLYKMEKFVCRTMAEDAPHNSFDGLCKEITAFSSGCGKKTSPRVKTCRAKKNTARSTLRRNRMKRYTQSGGFL